MALKITAFHYRFKRFIFKIFFLHYFKVAAIWINNNDFSSLLTFNMRQVDTITKVLMYFFGYMGDIDNHLMSVLESYLSVLESR